MQVPNTIPETQAVLKRLEELEKKIVRWKRGVLGVAALLGLGVLMGQAAPRTKTIEAEELILRDENGKARMTLRVTKHGPMVGLFNATGEVQAGLGALEGGAVNLTLYDGNAKPRVMVGSVRTGDPGILILNAQGDTVFAKP